MQTAMSEAQYAAIRAELRARVTEAKRDPAAAKARLVREGFYTEAGELTERYGGPRQPNKDNRDE